MLTRDSTCGEDFRMKRAPKFPVEVQCQMKDCQVKATIQQLFNRNNDFKEFLAITFRGDACHQPGDFQLRQIIDEEKDFSYQEHRNTEQRNTKHWRNSRTAWNRGRTTEHYPEH